MINLVRYEIMQAPGMTLKRRQDEFGKWWYGITDVGKFAGLHASPKEKLTALGLIDQVVLGSHETGKVVLLIDEDVFLKFIMSIKYAKAPVQKRLDAIKDILLGVATPKVDEANKSAPSTPKTSDTTPDVIGTCRLELYGRGMLSWPTNTEPPKWLVDKIFSIDPLAAPKSDFDVESSDIPDVESNSVPDVEPPKPTHNIPVLPERVDITNFYSAIELVRLGSVMGHLIRYADEYHKRMEKTPRAYANIYCKIVRFMGLHPNKSEGYIPPDNMEHERRRLVKNVDYRLSAVANGNDASKSHTNARFHINMNQRVIDYITKALENKGS